MTDSEPRVIFMGSPQFAVPVFTSLAKKYSIAGVVTQPDRPAGRGRKLTPPPVKLAALEIDIPVIQPEKMKEPGVFEQLTTWQPDVIVVAAFGQILRRNVLELAPFGCINVHASYLPRWRGAAPIQAAILSGDEFTGVSIMKLDPGIDTGPVYTRQKELIREDDNAVLLEERLSIIGAELLMKTLPGILSGVLVPTPQDENQATYASMLHKEDGLLDFNQSALQLALKVRAYYDWPGAYFVKDEVKIKLRKVHVLSDHRLAPGEFGQANGYPTIGTSSGDLQLIEMQPPGRNWMDGRAYLNGNPEWLEKNEP